MKNLFATVSYFFNNFYSNLNTQGQMIFSLIMFLIITLCVILFITYVMDGIKAKIALKKIKTEENAKVQEEIDKVFDEKEDEEALYVNEKTEIEDIASAISEALNEDKPISLTNFEEDQERTAIISIDELMRKAKELELINDEEENTGINFLEKYNLEPAEVKEVIEPIVTPEPKTEVKAFKVSQVISPIYGVKKDVIDKNK